MTSEVTTLIAIIGVGIGLATLMLTIARTQNQQIANLEVCTNKRIDDLEARTNQRFDDLIARNDQRFEEVNRRIDDTNRRIDVLQARVEGLAEEVAEVKGVLSVIRDGLPIRIGE